MAEKDKQKPEPELGGNLLEETLSGGGARGLTGYLDRTIPKPTPRVTDTTTEYPAPIYPTAAMQPYSLTLCPEEWETQDRLVAGAIVSNIVDPVGLGINELKRASEIWQNLIKRFEKCDE
ncbi:hypothetical protein EV359DRAFT_68462 [Lentinula novae-zelandiae]|nr:hypothetical protein EV359DRAFT_68462 [Lentinula novae-zelandiae]